MIQRRLEIPTSRGGPTVLLVEPWGQPICIDEHLNRRAGPPPDGMPVRRFFQALGLAAKEE